MTTYIEILHEQRRCVISSISTRRFVLWNVIVLNGLI